MHHFRKMNQNHSKNFEFIEKIKVKEKIVIVKPSYYNFSLDYINKYI